MRRKNSCNLQKRNRDNRREKREENRWEENGRKDKETKTLYN